MAIFETDEVGGGTVACATDVFRAELARHRERAATPGRRGWFVRRALGVADILGISLAFAIASLVFEAAGSSDRIQPSGEIFLFAVTLPMWLMLAKLQGLYERDEERADHSTVDEFVGVLIVVTLGTWFFRGALVDDGPRLAAARSSCRFLGPRDRTGHDGARDRANHRRRSTLYAMRTVVLGAGEIGQLVARKIRQHPEYGLELIGFVDSDPLARRVETREFSMLGGLDDLQELVAEPPRRPRDRGVLQRARDRDDGRRPLAS